MAPLRFSINTTIDGCCDHRAVEPNEEIHRHATEMIAQADALLFGRVIYQMMEEAWRKTGESWPDWMPQWMIPFAQTIDAARKYVVTSTLESVDWNAEIVRPRDLEATVRALKQRPGRGIYVAGVTLPTALAELGLIDEYEFLVQPRLAGHGPTPFAGLSRPLDLALAGRRDFPSGAVALRYVPRK